MSQCKVGSEKGPLEPRNGNLELQNVNLEVWNATWKYSLLIFEQTNVKFEFCIVRVRKKIYQQYNISTGFPYVYHRMYNSSLDLYFYFRE